MTDKMDNSGIPATASSKRQSARNVGRPRTTESGYASLSTLLNLVRTGVATTRQELERHSELGRAVVSDRLSTLVKLGLLEEGRLGEAAGGRAPRHMQFRAAAGSVEVAVIDRSSIAAGIADLNGSLLMEHHEAFDITAGGAALVERLTTLFEWMRDERSDLGSVWGIGLALPGPVAQNGELGISSPVLQAIEGWTDYPFVENLVVRNQAPVWVRSGIQMMTAGEHYAGAGGNRGNLILVKLGRSLSAGVVADGKLLRGSEGASGLIGYTRLGDESLDSLAGSDAIAAAGLQAAQDAESPFLQSVLARNGVVDESDVGHGAQFGDAYCIELLTRSGRLIGEALAPLANLLNPDVIALGGAMAHAGDTILAAVREAVYRQAHPLVTRNLKIVTSQMGGTSGLVGAAHVVTEEIFAPRFLQGWILNGSPLHHPEFADLLDLARSTIAVPSKGRAAPPLERRPVAGSMAEK
ncbi:MAG: ROK family protein [Aliihoeflea sp.]